MNVKPVWSVENVSAHFRQTSHTCSYFRPPEKFHDLPLNPFASYPC